jgi:hypothetical protein
MNFFTSKKARAGKAISVLGATLGVLLFSASLFSQANFGRILGTITDQTGGVIAGATVTVLDTERGVAKVLVANDAGEYNAPSLTPGTYKVRAEAKGFKAFERQNIVLEVGKEVRVDATLQPGEQTQTVTVTEQIPLVETTNATLGGTIDNADISDLPLNGRNYQNLLGLRPGVMLNPGGGPWTQSTNGIRPDETAWNIDGILNANFFDGRPVVGMSSPFSDAATILPVDAIQEFNLEENPKAEFGWKPGAVVNVGIKSGTNKLHGSAYGFYRSEDMDARNYYNPGLIGGSCQLNPTAPAAVQQSICDKTQAQLRQYGGVVGGPIKKDKLFFFAGYEGLHSLIGNVFSAAVPQTVSTGSPLTSMVDAINAQILSGGAASVSPVSLDLAGCTLGPPVTCTGGLFPNSGASSNYLSTFPNNNKSNNGIGKLDYHVNSKNTISGMYFLGKYNATGEDHNFINQAFTNTVPISTLTTVESWIWTPNSTLVNELRGGYTRTSFNFVNVDVSKIYNGPTGKLNTGVTNPLTGGVPNIGIVSVGGPGLGTANNRPQYYSPNPVYNIADAVSYLKGKHAFKFGGEYMHVEGDATVYVSGRGVINFNTLQDFFAGNPSGSPAGQLLSGNPATQATWNHYAVYAQDDWRVTPKVIVNLGLRYEYHSPIKEKNNLLGSFDPTKGLVQQGTGGLGTIWNASKTDFSPRLGFAWDVTGKGTTVVRGGFSIIYSSFILENFLGQFGLRNDPSTSPAAVPTGATIVTAACQASLGAAACAPVGTSGGNITLGTSNFVPGQLCWDASKSSTCAAGVSQGTVFPTSSKLRCGSGVTTTIAGVPTTDPGPCDVMGVDPNLRDPYITNWNFGIQHAFNPNLSLEVSYVGNRGSRLLSFRDINQAPLGAGWCINSTLTAAQKADACAGPSPAIDPSAGGTYNGQATQEARPLFTKFPYLGFINWASNTSHSNYNSLQATLTQRASHGLSFTAGYTYGHGLDNGSLNRFGPLPQDSNNTAAEYASGDFDIRHRFTLTTTYNIPGIKGFGQVLEGWTINSIVNYQTPQPWYAFDAFPSGNNYSGNGESADRWDIFGSPDGFRSSQNSIPWCSGFTVNTNGTANSSGVTCEQFSNIAAGPQPDGSFLAPAAIQAQAATCAKDARDPKTLAAFGCYATSTGVITPTKLGAFGNMGRNIFRDSGFKNWDLSVFKNFTFKERYGAQFRVEVFNVLNHPLFANPYDSSSFGNSGNALNGNSTFGSAGGTPDVIAGNNLIGSGSARVMQLGLKFTF